VFYVGTACAVLGPQIAWLDRFRRPLGSGCLT
jgi:hypothetical protein